MPGDAVRGIVGPRGGETMAITSIPESTTASVDSLGEDAIRNTVEEYLAAYEARDLDRLIALFADDAELTVAPGTFRGKGAVRRFFEWDAELSPAVSVRERETGVLVSGHVAACEHVTSATYKGIPYEEPAVKVFEFDDAGKIRRLRSYYDKLALIHQIAAGYPGLRGRAYRALTGYLVALGRKGLDASES
jgi:ketosteroid isomerase-like protein